MVTHYNEDPMTAFGFNATAPFEIVVFGKIYRQHDTIKGTAEVVKFPGRKINLGMRKLEDFP